ncbi:MAG: hypothetical protein M3P30_11150 [Chloroflexota bacterium]|nr:hypothetical protein [Chloroflexota bacterium]
MGIDVFMSWGTGPSFDGNFEESFRGANGYLREAYHGGPYATVVLVPEAFGDPLRAAQAFGMARVESAAVGTDADGYALIPAGVLRSRLAATLLTVADRYRTVYDEECGEGHPALREFVEFVELAERMQAQLGHPVGVSASW